MQYEMHQYRVTSQMVGQLASIAECVGKLEGVKLQRPSPVLRRKNRIHTIQSTLSIEGNSLTRDQVTALIDNKRVIGPRKDLLEVNNAIDLYYQIGGLDPYSLDDLLKAHTLFMKGLLPSAGQLRKAPIGTIRAGDVFHEAPAWEHVDPMIQMLFAYLREDNDHWLLKSCRFHFQLEHIHPFLDGNGRMGRLWQTRLLMEYHPIFEFLPVEDLIKAHQGDYYQALAEGDDSGDATEFVAFMLFLIRESMEALMVDTRSISLSATDRIHMAHAHFGSARFSRKDYQSFFKTISTATASRDLHQAVKMGLFRKSGDKRTAVYRIVKG